VGGRLAGVHSEVCCLGGGAGLSLHLFGLWVNGLPFLVLVMS
jgi:hypothetical protein